MQDEEKSIITLEPSYFMIMYLLMMEEEQEEESIEYKREHDVNGGFYKNFIVICATTGFNFSSNRLPPKS